MSILTFGASEDRSFVKFASRRLRRERGAHLIWIYVIGDSDNGAMKREALDRVEEGDDVIALDSSQDLVRENDTKDNDQDVIAQVVNFICQG